MRRLHTLLAILLAVSLTAPALAQESSTKPDGAQLLERLTRKLDNLYRAETSKGEMTMVVITPNYKRTLRMKITTRGLDDTLIRIMSPRKERGISTLKKGNEMWNYLPKVKKVIRVPPSMMMGSWMGSDLNNDDLVRGSSWEEDYTASLITAGDKSSEWCFKSVPKPKAPVTWSKVISCFDKKSELPTRQEFYDEKDRKVRVMTFDKVKELGGRKVPSRMTILPLSKDKKGHKTIMEFNEMEYDVPVNGAIFSLSNLKRGR